jgi:quinoprotein glucose dehydrogenase
VRNFGPALVTAGGLVFHAGTRDGVLRAHDVETGEVLARFPLPAGLHGGPISYRPGPDAPQLLVVAPGGHAYLGSELGGQIIAYGLPR